MEKKNTSSDLLRLDNQLCFSLYVCSKEIIKKYKPLLDPLGLTYTGYITLLALWEQDLITVKELGQKLYLDSGTLTPLLKKLETLDYIQRIRSTTDERNVYIQLTPKGLALKEKAFCIPKEMLGDMQLKEQEIITLHHSLQRLMHFIDESR